MAIQNKTVDLNNQLFEQLERLNQLDLDEIDDKALNKEIKRAGAIANITKQIIENEKVQLDVAKTVVELNRCGIKNYVPENLMIEAK